MNTNIVRGATVRTFGNPVPQSVVATQSVGSYDQLRFNEITTALTAQGYDKLMKPTNVELSYVSSVFQSKGFHDMDAVTYQAISEIGKADFEQLNKRMTIFTKMMKGVELVGMCDLLGDLSQSVDKMDFEGVWNKALTAKPSLLAMLLSIFNKHAPRKSRQGKLDAIKAQFGTEGDKLEAKLVGIESALRDQKKSQETNIEMMEKAFEAYYEAFIGLRKQFALIVYLEQSFKAQLENFKKTPDSETDLVFNRKLTDYEERYVDIQNKRLILHKSLLQLPMIVEQNKNLSNVCRTLIKEIENTLHSSFPMIRSNLVTIGVAIIAQKGMDSTKSAQDLERNAATLAQEVTGNLAVTAATMAADARLADANNVANLVKGMVSLSERLKTATAESQTKFDEATSVINQATSELADIMK